MAVSQGEVNYQGLYAPGHYLDHATYTGIPKNQTVDFGDTEEPVKLDTSNPDHKVLLSEITTNSLVRMNPIYNGRFDKVHAAKTYFRE